VSCTRSDQQNDPLEREQPPLHLDARVPVATDAVRADDTMARDDEREAIRRAHRARGPRGPRPTCEGGQLAVGHDLAPRHTPKCLDDVTLERRRPVQIDLDVPEVHGVAAEKGLESLDERVEAAPRRLVPAAEPLPDA